MSLELHPLQHLDQGQRPTGSSSNSTQGPESQTSESVEAVPEHERLDDDTNHTQRPATQASEPAEAESEHGRFDDDIHESNQERLSLNNHAVMVESSSGAADDEVPSDACKIASRRNSNNTMITILTDCIVVLLPLSFIVVAIVIWKLNSTQVGDSLSAWRNVVNVLATAFPILFASIVGRLMFESARWKLEKGGSIGLLEQLLGSRTVGSTLTTIFQLRTFNWVTAVLLVIWAFSPLGAQGILRLLDTRPETVVQPVNITYFDNLRAAYKNDVQFLEGTASDDGANRNIFGNLAILYNMLIIAPKSVKVDSMDPWGNVRIPFLDPAVTESWANTSNDPLNVRYSSLAGVPVAYGNAENSSFSIESTYIQLECRNVTRFPAVGPNGPLRHSTSNMTSPSTNNRVYPNGSWYGYGYERGTGRASSAQWCIAVDRFIDSLWLNRTERLRVPSEMANETGIEVAPSNLLLKLGLRQGDWFKRTFDEEEYTCRAAQKYVQSNITCLRPGGQRLCKVVAQRPSQRSHASEFITRLSSPRTFNFIARELPLTTGKATDGVLDPSIYYLKDPTFENVSNGAEVQLGDLDPHQVGIRLSQLINTYIALSQLSGLITNGSSNGTTVGPNITIIGESSVLSEVFIVSTPWLWLCLLSSLVLLSGGVMSVIFTHLADGPEVLGSVSTVVRNSRFIDLPSNMSWMDGSDITYKIKEMRIKYGYTREISGEEAVVAVGHEYQTSSIKDTA